MNSTDQLNFRILKTKFMKLLEDKFYLENSRIHVLATFLDRASRTTIRPILSSSTRRRRNGYSKKSVNKKGTRC
uniref:Uncharacterized protein n=1 Tax=Ditylenchus dipsaci TaxID=166011 RepID=A0A915EPH3_9BILA